ncbi:MAG TPA: AAA-like domain-containing protein [Verrucomicrobiae bacterium]|nr:AAA-like domain-containing protein [Verrucomicrobiae bacterium]
MTTAKKTAVVLVYKRDNHRDEALVALIQNQLDSDGCSVFLDRDLTMGVEWAREIEARIRSADVVIPVLSADSIHSEMLGFEVETAHEASQLQAGRPRLLPVRLNYTGPLPEPLSSILDPIQYFLWEGDQDNLGLVTELAEALKHLPEPETLARPAHANGSAAPIPSAEKRPPSQAATARARPAALEAIGGAVPLDSQFYITRPADGELRAAISKRDSIILIKGARQMGKTSLLARGLQFAREQGTRAVSTDLQKFNAADFKTVDHLYRSMAESIADQLELKAAPADSWDARRGPNANFERFLRREVLDQTKMPLTWGLDEVDRLFVTPFGSEVFGLLRSWHNERALDPAGPWSMLTIAIAYATEAHLFITDINQSPFNVGTRLDLEDFTSLQVAELNRRYHNPIRSEDELNRFCRLVGGHPYLVRRGLHELATHKHSFNTFEEMAARDEAFYGDHLRRMLVLLVRDTDLCQVMRGVLNNEPCPTAESFDRLRSAGLVLGHIPEEARPRCRLYAMYLRRHLL